MRVPAALSLEHCGQVTLWYESCVRASIGSNGVPVAASQLCLRSSVGLYWRGSPITNYMVVNRSEHTASEPSRTTDGSSLSSSFWRVCSIGRRMESSVYHLGLRVS